MRGLCHRYLVNDCATAFNDESIDSHSSAYDALSRPTARTDGGTGCQPVQSSFTYNDRSEIIAASIGTNHFLHAYDTIGNQTNHVANAATNTFAHNALNQMVGRGVPTAPQAFAISHDLDGNLTSDGFFSYSYDAANRLASVSSNGVVLVANEYDYRGRRMKKTTPTTETTFVYDGWDLVYEREAVGDVTNETFYCWGSDLSGTMQCAGGVGGLLYLKRNGTIYVPHADANGNIVRYTDTAGNVVAEYTYDAFGKTIAQSGLMADIFRHRFSTKYFDSETGLYYYGYRFYSPMLMRWLNRDPLEEGDGDNLYLFCNNSSLYVVDTDGRRTWTEATAINELRDKVREMREIGYNFAADALEHYIGNHSSNIDLSRYASQIYNDSGWQQSFLDSVIVELKKKDPNGTNKKVEIGDMGHKESFTGNLQTGRIDNMFRQMFSHRFQPYHDMGLFYALYGSHYSYIGTASWCRKTDRNFLSMSFYADVETDLEVVSWDPLSYGGSGVRDIAPSYSAARYLQDIHGYRNNFIYLKWKEKGNWRMTTYSSARGNYTYTHRRSAK